MQAIVLTFDRLPAHLLSCCGNEWIETPAFDRLAARSILFEEHYAETADAAGPAHPWWSGRLERFPGHSEDTSASGGVFERLSAAGVRCRMISERETGLPTAGLSQVESVGGDDGLEIERDQVPFARLVSRGLEVLPEFATGEPQLLWLHSRGVPSPWLPPKFFADLYLDELEDEVASEDDDEIDGSGREIAQTLLRIFEAEPALASLLLSDESTPAPDDGSDSAPGTDDPDSITPEMRTLFDGMEQPISRFVFAGYVSLLDHLLGSLLDAVEAQAPDALLIITAARGQSFGERSDFIDPPDSARHRSHQDHSHLDPEASGLSDSELRTPLLLRRTGQSSSGRRVMGLVQPSDIPATLLDWFTGDGSAASRNPPFRPFGADGGHSLCPALDSQAPQTHSVTYHFGRDGSLAVRTSHWLLATESPELPSADAAASRHDGLCVLEARPPGSRRRRLTQ